MIGEILEHKNTDRNDRVLIIDGTNMYLRVWSSATDVSVNGEFVGGVLGFLRSLALSIREFSPTRCIVTFDAKGGSLRRKQLYPEYKHGRRGKVTNTKIVFLTEDAQQVSMKNQLNLAIRCLLNLPVSIVSVDHIEADDAIAYLVSTKFVRSKKIRIVSTDRDFLQLVSDRIEVYSPVKKILYDEKKIKEELGICSQNYLLYRALTGDKSDNIPGVRGIGLTTLLNEFPELADKKITLEYLFARCDKIISETKKPKKIIKNIVECRDTIQLNYALMQLQDVDISISSKERVSNMVDSPYSLNQYELRKIFIQEYLMNNFKDFDSWIMFSFSNLNAWTL